MKRAQAWEIGALALPIAIIALTAARFAGHQSLWVDETTQLRGIELGPWRLFPWLAGHGPDLGVPADRMPPGAYLMQIGWASLTGVSERALRWFGIACTIVGATGAVAAARRAFGWRAALAAGAVLALSINLTVYAVEIRAYPVFFMFAGLGLYALVRAAQEPDGSARNRFIALVALALIAAEYTHFFGVVFAGAVLAGLLAEALASRKRLLPVVLAGIAAGVAGAGLLPFVKAAAKISSDPEAVPGAGARATALVKLVYRLYGHPAMTGSRIAAGLATAGFLIAAAAAIASLRQRAPAALAAAAALAAGLAAVAAASLVVVGFNAAAPHYNVWALPFVALVLSAPLSLPASRLRTASLAGLVLLWAGCAVAMARFQWHEDLYAHGPQRQLEEIVRRLGSDRVSVVYDPQSDAVGHVFFPIRYDFAGKVPQYRFDEASAAVVPFDAHEMLPPLRSRPWSLVVRARHTPAADLGATGRGAPPIDAARFLEREGWKLVSSETIPALVTADLRLLSLDGPVRQP